MKEPKPLTKMWKKAKLLTEQKNVEKALPLLETMIVYLAKLTLKGITEVEGVRVDLMKDRCWLSLESLGVLPEYNEEEHKELGTRFKNT